VAPAWGAVSVPSTDGASTADGSSSVGTGTSVGASALGDAAAHTQIDAKSEEHQDLQTNILLVERLVLQTLCFDMQIVHPYNDSLELHKSLKLFVDQQQSRELKQVVVNFIGDSFRSALCLLHEPKAISAAAMYLSLLKMNLQPLQSGMLSATTGTGRSAPRPCKWVDIIANESGTSEHVLRAVCDGIMDVYAKGYKRSGYMNTADSTVKGPEVAELRNRLRGVAESGPELMAATGASAEPAPEASTSGRLYGNVEESYEAVWGVPSAPVRKVTVNVVKAIGASTGLGPGLDSMSRAAEENSPSEPPPPAPPTPSPRIDESPMAPPPPPGDTPLGVNGYSYIGNTRVSSSAGTDKFSSQLPCGLEDTPLGSAVPPPPPTPPSEENARKRMKI